MQAWPKPSMKPPTTTMSRVVVLRGLAGCFCLGGDFSEFLDATKHQQLIAAVTDMFRTLATFPKPILACVDGDAVGVGCTILFHCDMVIASGNSTFRVPFVDFGLVPDAATSILAPQKLGYAGAFRFFCLGDTLGAEDARALGLVAEIVADGSAEEAALGRARQLAKKPVAALLQTRGLLKGDTGVLCDRIDQEIIAVPAGAAGRHHAEAAAADRPPGGMNEATEPVPNRGGLCNFSLCLSRPVSTSRGMTALRR